MNSIYEIRIEEKILIIIKHLFLIIINHNKELILAIENQKKSNKKNCKICNT